MTTLEVEPVALDGAGAGWEATHLFCACNPDIALCGRDISNSPIEDDDVDDDDVCVVCDDLLWTACRFCGRVDG